LTSLLSTISNQATRSQLKGHLGRGKHRNERYDHNCSSCHTAENATATTLVPVSRSDPFDSADKETLMPEGTVGKLTM
jgi:hypothetical protein